MSRLLAALFALDAFVALAPAAPVPKHLMPKEPLYCSVQKGTCWEYTNTGMMCYYEATDVKPTKQGETVVTIDLVHDGKKTPSEKLDVSPRGIFRIEVNGNARGLPMRLLRCPTELDTEWPFNFDDGGVFAYRGTMKVTGTENVTVPAGTFSAIRVEEIWHSKSPIINNGNWAEHNRYTSWYAPDIGLVKQTSPGGYKRELKSFTLGKS